MTLRVGHGIAYTVRELYRILFSSTGVSRLVPLHRPLEDVLVEKYHWEPADARAFSNFLEPMLDFKRNQRISATLAARHPWLKV